MNIFWLDSDPKLAARYHCDSHVNKMLVESAQMLSTALREHGCDDDYLYSRTHANHPCTLWVTYSRDNFERVIELCRHLYAEKQHRFGGDHKSWHVIEQMDPSVIPDFPGDDPPLAMPDEYHCDDYVEAYREYYRRDKSHLHEWTNRDEPHWL